MRLKSLSPPAPSPATPSPKCTMNEPEPHEPIMDEQPEDAAKPESQSIKHGLFKLARMVRRLRFHLVGIICIYIAWVLAIGPWYYDQFGTTEPSAPKMEKPLVIAVMGMTGVGKSSFIKELTKDANITIGHSLKSCTDAIQYSSLSLRTESGITRNVILADTPGFDDSRAGRSDAGILEDIADWLEEMYDANMKLTGIIYLHKITDERIAGSAMRNLRMMRHLVGEGGMKNVMFVTNRWETVAGDPNALAKAKAREHELLSNDNGEEGYWYRMTSIHGAAYSQHYGSYTSAKAILTRIVKNSPVFIQLQEELAKGLHIIETAAGEAILTDLEKDRMRQEKVIANLKADMEWRTEEQARMMREYKENFDKELEKGEQAQEEARRRFEQLEEDYNAFMKEAQEDHARLEKMMKRQEEEIRKLKERRGFFSKAGEKMDDFIRRRSRNKHSSDEL